MASDIATRRLQRELRSMQKKPMTNPIIVAAPRESNILEWHYVVEGPKDTAFEGGYFWGKLIFPKEYPLKPPGVLMFTPSGRFKPNRRLCLSMSDCECSVSSDLQMMEFGTIKLRGTESFAPRSLQIASPFRVLSNISISPSPFILILRNCFRQFTPSNGTPCGP